MSEAAHAPHGKRRFLALAVVGAVLALLVVPVSTVPAMASDLCGQETHVWVGGLDNNGAIWSNAPGQTIYVQEFHGVFLTGVVSPITSIDFFFTQDNGQGQVNLPATTLSDLNCVVHDGDNHVFVFPQPETQQWYATYTDWRTGNRITSFLGTIVVTT